MGVTGNFFRTHTAVVTLAEIITTAITGITDVAATSGGNVLIDGGATVTDRGVCWNTTGSPTTADSHTHDSSGTGSFTSSLTGLSANTMYHVRAYAINSVGTAYGNEQDFTTASTGTLPTVVNIYVGTITENSATAYSSITSDGGNAVTARGVCWSTSINPTLADTHTHDSFGTGTYYSYPSGLTYCTTYWLRAYATNGNGTAYSDNVSFNTTRPSGLSTYVFHYAITIDGVYKDIRENMADVNLAWYDWHNQGGRSIQLFGLMVQLASFAGGTPVYSGVFTECRRISDGYYLFMDVAPDRWVLVISGAVYSTGACSYP